MFTNKRVLLPGIGIAVVVALAVVVGVVAASSGDDGDDAGSPEGVSTDDGTRLAGDQGGGLAICAEDAPDCNDMIDTPDGDASDDDASPDDPVSSEPVTSIDDIDPDECNLVHNIDACQLRATAAAAEDLAARLGIQPDEVDLTSAELTQWPDACLGIAQPDTACAEVITTGFKITFEHAGTQYEYHTDGFATQALLAE